MILYHKLAKKMVDEFEVINFEYLPREENQMADALAISSYVPSQLQRRGTIDPYENKGKTNSLHAN